MALSGLARSSFARLRTPRGMTLTGPRVAARACVHAGSRGSDPTRGRAARQQNRRRSRRTRARAVLRGAAHCTPRRPRGFVPASGAQPRLGTPRSNRRCRLACRRSRSVGTHRRDAIRGSRSTISARLGSRVSFLRESLNRGRHVSQPVGPPSPCRCVHCLFAALTCALAAATALAIVGCGLC